MYQSVRPRDSQFVEQELSEGRSSAQRRGWLLITSIVVIPIAIGVLVSTVLYTTRAIPPSPAPLPSPSATDTFVRNGPVLLLEPATSAPVSVLANQEVEIVLNTGVGQTVSTLNPYVLDGVANPPCHLTAVCGVTGAKSWTFLAVRPGVTHLHVIFGTGDCPQRASCPRVLELFIPITVRPAAI